MHKCQSFGNCDIQPSLKIHWIYYCIKCFLKIKLKIYKDHWINLTKRWVMWLSYKTENIEYIYKITDKKIFSYENIIKKIYNKKIF